MHMSSDTAKQLFISPCWAAAFKIFSLCCRAQRPQHFHWGGLNAVGLCFGQMDPASLSEISRYLNIVLHGAVLYIACTRVVRNTIFSIPFPVSLEKAWGRRDEQSLCSAFPVYKQQSHMLSVLCLCLFTGVEHILPSHVDGGGPHSWHLWQPQPA